MILWDSFLSVSTDPTNTCKVRKRGTVEAKRHFRRRAIRYSMMLPALVLGSLGSLAGTGYQRHLGQTGFVQEVRIQVLDERNSAVAGAQVNLVTYGSPATNAITDSSGTARFPEIAVGAYTLVVNVSGKESYRDQFEIRESDGNRSSVIHVLVPMRNNRANTKSVSLNELRAPKKAQKDYVAAVDLIRKHDYKNALRTLDEALTVYPEYAKAHNARGVVLGMLNRPKESEASLLTAIRVDGDFAEPHFNLGKLLLELDRAPEARQELQRAVDLQSGHMPAIELLIDAMLTIHDENSAVSLVHSLHSRGVDHPAQLHLEIGAELENHGMFRLAAEQYSLVLKDRFSDSDRQAAGGGRRRTESK
jgi:Tfp pilus assembly protein PilF